MSGSHEGMDRAVCCVDDHGASFTFSDGSREYILRNCLEQSSMIRSLLSEGEDRQQFTLVAPAGYMKTWIHLSRQVTQSESLSSVYSDTGCCIVELLQVSPCGAACAGMQLPSCLL